MLAAANNGLKFSPINRFMPVSLLIWTLLLATSLIWNVIYLNDQPQSPVNTSAQVDSPDKRLTSPDIDITASTTQTIQVVTVIHGSIWLAGLFIIGYIIRQNRRFTAQRLLHEQAIKEIATHVSDVMGDTFFQLMVKQMACVFDVKCALIGLLDKSNEQMINTLAIYTDGKMADNITYPLQGTPCFNVINEHACIYQDNVQQLFPEDPLLKDLDAQGYIGKTLRNGRGEPLGILVILDSKPLQNTQQMSELLDIFAARASRETARMLTEQELRRTHTMDAIGQLTGGLAHDFNNQLGIIIGYLDFLKEYINGEEKPDKWIDTATNAALHCNDLTRQLLSFSRTESSEKTLLDINVTLQELQPMFARSISSAIEIEYFFAENLWLTEIDPAEFQEAILNIIINARDAMPNGGKLLIETSNKFMDAQSASLNPLAQAAEYIQIMISDNGCGMNRDTLERIYEPFYTTKAKGKGTGLGMSMVYGFVKRSGGFINIDSEIESGTTLRIFLPRSNASSSELSDEQANESPPKGNETILIVDDEVDLLHLADNYLTELGYKTYIAENARQALDILAKHPNIDLLFSDIVMPGGLNGYELAQQVTRDRPQLKVLLTSGLTSKAIAQDDQVRFSAQMLNKPYRKINLAKRIRLVLNKDYTQ